MARVPEILFVDDEDSIRLTLPLVLEPYGFKISTAASVTDALRLMAERKFDVLISDMNIERAGDGFTVVNAMRSTQPNAVRFILTGYPAIETALQAVREGVDDYLIKPTEVAELVERIRLKLEGETRTEQVRPKRLSEVIEADQENITGKWLEFAKQDADLGRIPLTDSERKDHLPGLIKVTVGILEGKELTAENRAVSGRHGELRYRQGYSAPLLLREAKLLQDAVASCIQRKLLEIQISTLIPDMVRAFGILQHLLEESLNAFLRQDKPKK
jgi:DNA-binding response OmpR family regulator